MKRFLVFLLVVVGPMIGFGQTLRTTINAGILSQGNKGITATKLNNVLVTVADSVSSKANKIGGVFSGTITAPSFVRAGGTSLQFLKADGSVDASAFAILGNNNVFTGTNTFLTPVFANSVSTSAFSSITGAWSNTGNLGVFSLRYNTKSGGSTVTWNPVRLDANGFVGIGMDPTQAFEVAGAAKFNSAITATSLAASGAVSAASLSASGAITSSTLSASGAVSALSYSSTTGANFATSSGNVLLGTTTNQGYKLDVNGTLRTVNDAYFATTSGNVGVGTTIPGAKLHIFGSSLFETVLGGQTYIPFTDGKNYFRGIEHFFANATGGGDFMTIKASGNVGIATVAPAQKLDVNGIAQATQFKLSALNTAPASATATGVVGEIRIDASYIYICTATNTWKRSALTTW
jgi:hypothetical protein